MSRFNLGDFAGAQQAFEQAVQQGPNRSRYHFWVGFAAERQYKLDEARQQYEEELRQHPDTDTEAAKRLKDLTSPQK
jgi:predicted TPR repeat methyltransferase